MFARSRAKNVITSFDVANLEDAAGFLGEIDQLVCLAEPLCKRFFNKGMDAVPQACGSDREMRLRRHDNADAVDLAVQIAKVGVSGHAQRARDLAQTRRICVANRFQ